MVNRSTDSLGETLVTANQDLWAAMRSHPWVLSLADGTLPEAALIAWAQQCRLYCLQERLALMVLRSYNPPEPLDALLAHLVDDTEREPRQLAETLASLGAPVADREWPICLAYGSYVNLAAREGLVEGLSAVYACERAYLDTWTAVMPSVAADSRWHSWVENWSGDLFRSVVNDLGHEFDALAGTPSTPTYDRLARHFRNVALFEYSFWEMCWSQQGWLGGIE